MNLKAIISADESAGWKAEECLQELINNSEGPVARAELLAAAQVYALLELANVGAE